MFFGLVFDFGGFMGGLRCGLRVFGVILKGF